MRQNGDTLIHKIWGYSTMVVHTAVNRRVIGSSPIIPVWLGRS